MPTSVVGRDVEIASIRAFVTGISDGAASLVLEGEAGMGKTTLWRIGVEAAESAGLCVLDAEPAESETALSFSGLGDLLDPVLEEAIAPLPAAQRSALSRALVLEEVEGPPPDPHAVGVAVLNALRGLASARDVLVAVDDVQWLDAASAAALAYAARRLKSEHVGLLLACRSGAESMLAGELRRIPRCGDVTVGSLDPAALHQVVQRHLGVALPRPLLAEVHEASGGNPFYALELVRMLQRSGASVEAGRSLPLPDSLRDLVHARLLALQAESRHFLVAAAAHAHPTVAITEAASGVDADTGLAPAVAAGIVELDGTRIRFTHPLLAAGVMEVADPGRRAEVHRRLAELLEDPEASAWQLAACRGEPDATVAAVLDDAARHARARGALRPAALLLDQARSLTPGDDPDAAVRRGVEAAFLHFESGDAPRAETQLRGIVAPLEPGLLRARALWMLARVRTYDVPAEAAELFREVVDQAAGDPELLAAAHEGVASSLYYAFERFEESQEHADAARRLARELGDRALEGDVLISTLGLQANLGDPAAEVTAGEAEALQSEAAGRRVLDQPLLAVAEYWILVDEHERARAAFAGLLQQVDDIGDESTRPYLLAFSSQAELALGHLAAARESARSGRIAAEQSGERLFAGYNRALEALALARLGDVELARQTAHEALAEARSRYEELIARSALGHLALANGAPSDCVEQLEPALEFARREGLSEPGATPFVVDLVEALVELGRRNEAVEILDWFEGNAGRLERLSARANAARCRGLLAGQAGDLEASLAAYEQALAWHAQVDLPLDRARTLLALGAAQRRLKRRREARGTLEEALAVFEGIGAALWAERTRAELKRISGRAATPGALTPAEERVAALVAEGKTNKEVAAALFISERTVEGHLARVFGKLRIRHRAEIATVLALAQTHGAPSSNTGGSPVSAEPSAP
jgi:DNA-binding CsgD family transcriptional regulator